jgi:hypothetical protein
LNERQYLIEILLRAREQVSQVAQRAARALDDVTKSQDRMSDSAKRSAQAAQEQRGALQQLYESRVREKRGLDDSAAAYRQQEQGLRRNAAALREQARQTRSSADELRELRTESARAAEGYVREAQSLLDLAQTRQDDVGKIDKQTEGLRKQAAAARRMADENRRVTASLDRQIASIDRNAASFERSSRATERSARTAERDAVARERSSTVVQRSISSLVRQISTLDARTNSSTQSATRFGRTLERLGLAGGQARSSLRGLNAEFQGLAIALAVKYAQSLITALAGLAAQFAAVAAAAGQAAAGIAAAVGAGAAQAIPVVGVLAAAFGRLAAILKVVKLENQQQLRSSQDAQTAARAQRTAADQVRSAQERVAEANRNVADSVANLNQARTDAAREELRAQQEVNRSRREAIRTVEDLISAEEQSVLSVEQAQSALRRAVQSGDVAGAAQAELDLRDARTTRTRARQDAAPVRARGVEGVQAVTDAEQRLGDVRRANERQVLSASRAVVDARRREAQATDDLARTRRESKETLDQETASVNKLQDSLKQLTPAERNLYDRIIALQSVYRRVARPITDILTRAFTDVVDVTIAKLQDPRILNAFRGIAVQISRAIRTATREAAGPESTSVFLTLAAEATRNIPTVTRILTNFFRTARSLVVDALPAFRLLLGYVEDYSARLRDFVGAHNNALRDFFLDGVRYAQKFFDLGLAVANLFLTLAGPGGGAAEGARTVEYLTDRIDDLTQKVRDNADSVRDFFSRSRVVLDAVISVVATLGTTIIKAFDPGSVTALAEFLNLVLIPAFGNALELLGLLVKLFHEFFSVPGVAQVAQMAATMLILAKGLTIIRLAILDILEIVPNFLRAMGLMAAAEEGAATGLAAVSGFGLVVLAIAAVIAAVVLLDKKLHFLGPTWEWIKNAAVDAWDWIKGAASDTVDWFKDVWTQGLLYWLRQPFIAAYKWFTGGTLGKAIIRDVSAVIDFLAGPAWANIKAIIVVPFELARTAVAVAWAAIRTIVVVALDVLAGRFDRIGGHLTDIWGGVWDTILDATATAVNAVLLVIEKLLDAFGKIPKIGGPFKDAAAAIRETRDSIDEWRKGARDGRDEQDKVNKSVDDAIPKVTTLRKRYDAAREAVANAKPGTDAYREAVNKAKNAHDRYNDALSDTADKTRGARRPVRVLKSNIEELGNASSDTAEAVAADLNAVLEEVGAKEINIHIRRARRRSAAQNLTDTDNPLLGSPFAGARYTGGIANPFSSSASDDHVIVDPYGQPVAAVSGTEGIVNTPQMGWIDQAMGVAHAFGAVPWGSLGAMWGAGMRHYAQGGRLPGFQRGGTWNPVALARAIRQLGPYQLGENAKLGDTPQPGVHSPTGWHYRLGNSGAIDINADGAPGGEARWLDRLAAWLIRRGYHVLWRVAGHFDHLHVDAASGGSVPANLGHVRTPRVSGGEGTAIGRGARAIAGRLTRAANRYVDRQSLAMGDTGAVAMSASANVVAAFRRAIRTLRLNRVEQLALWEAGIVESGLRNLPYGDRDSLGSLQERAGIFGRGHAMNPFASALRFGRQVIAMRPWRGTAGALAQAAQRSAYPGRYDAVRARAMRYLQRGGPIKGLAAPRPAAPAAPSPLLRGGVGPALTTINELLATVADALRNVNARTLRRTKDLGARVRRAFEALTEDRGVLDQIHDAVTSIATRAAVFLQRRQFVVGRGGPVRRDPGAIETARLQLGALQETRGGLTSERDTLQGSIADAQRAVNRAVADKNKKAETAARAALANLRTRLEQNTVDLAQNAQDQVEAVESFQQALLDTVNSQAEGTNAAIDRWSRTAVALGVSIDPNTIIDRQIAVMKRQQSQLQRVLDRALRSGNTDLATQVRAQIDELGTQIQEAVAQQFQNTIDAVNNDAARSTARIDRAARRAQIGGTDYAALGDTLVARGNVMASQRTGLQILLDRASAAGNLDQVKNLTDQIEELDVSMSENTQAVKDNTDAGFNARTQQVNDTFGFAQTVLSGAQGFFQAITDRTGASTMPQQLTALQGLGGALSTQRQGLLGQLVSLTGDRGAANLSGEGLVNYLLGVSTGPALDSIMRQLDPTQQQSFKDLVGSLLSNVTATEQNTKAVEDLTGASTQAFSSSFWTGFRTAVFSGAGALLPRYAMTIPGADVGARIVTSGALMVHAGESVRPAIVNRDWGGDRGGDTYNLEITTPTEVLNPTDVGRQLAFVRNTSGR